MNSTKLIKSLLKQTEGEQLEFKTTGDIKDIGKTICSFLNLDGGQLLIGIGRNKEVLGISEAEELRKEIETYLAKHIVPESPLTVSLEEYDGKELILVKAWSGSKQPYIFDGNIYFRKKGRTIKASANDIDKLISHRQNSEIHWERQLAIGVELEDLDLTEIQQTISAAMKADKLNNGNGSNPIDFLTKYGLFNNGHFTNAVIVLFAKHPARFIPQSRLTIAYLPQGKTGDEFVDHEILENNLFKNYDRINNFLDKHLVVRRRFDSKLGSRQDSYPMPRSALREGVLNALIHRSYGPAHSNMSIIIYRDRIEITNSGKSPLKAKELKENHLSKPVNPDITHFAFLRGHIESIGRGTLKILEACAEASMPIPNWEIKQDSVKLTFYLNEKLVGPAVGANVGPAVGAISVDSETIIDGAIDGAAVGATIDKKKKLKSLLISILEYEGLRLPEYRNLNKLGSERTIERYLKILKAAKLIEFRGEAAHTGGYFITKTLREKI